jgi:putative flavoprotein involved in K+ transport
MHDTPHLDTVVIGAGAAGLMAGYYRQRTNRSFVILEADHRVGDTWRRHWDSLRLFSRPRFASLPGLRIGTRDCPSASEMADYLERYADHFDLPVQTNTRVCALTRRGDQFSVRTDRGDYLAECVVVATGSHRRRVVPAVAADLPPGIRQLHSMDYRRPGQFAPGGVLVVGAGNSGTDIALEAARHGHRTWLAGRHPGQVPVEIDTPAGRLGTLVAMFVFKHVLTRRTPMGRAAAARGLGHGAPLVRNKLAHLDTAGVTRIGRITGDRDGRPLADDGTVVDVGTVVWCTGSRPEFDWLHLPVFDEDGRPRHHRGVSTDVPGLGFLGLDFQFSLASATIQGMDRDARYLLRRLTGPAGPTRSGAAALDRAA